MWFREESLSFVEALESEVEAIFRAREGLELPGIDSQIQVFICGVRKDDIYHLFLALHLKAIRRNLVYVVDGVKKGKSGYEAALKYALEACRSAGLDMESLNLKFSTALREVVIRDIPVLLSPTAARQAFSKRKEELAELERMAALVQESEIHEEAAAGLSPAKRAARERSRQERQQEAKSAARKLAAEIAADEKMATVARVATGLFASGFDFNRPGSAPAPLTKSSVGTEPQFPPAEGGEVPACVPQEIQRLAEEVDRLRAEKAAAELRLAELSETARRAAERVEAERTERERLDAAKMLSEQRAEEAAESIRQAKMQLEEDRALRKRLEAEKTEAEQRTTEFAELARLAEGRAAVERAERERLQAEKEEADRRLATLAEQVRCMEARADAGPTAAERQLLEQAERERIDRDQLLADKSAAEERIAELASGMERLLAEKTAANQKISELSAATCRVSELAETARKAVERAGAERRERERLEIEKAKLEKRLQENAGEFVGTRKPVEVAHPPSVLPPLGGLFGNRPPEVESPVPAKRSSRSAVSGAFFKIDLSMGDLGYESAEDILEIHQSINRVQLSLEGFPNQYCTAYMISMKKGRGRQVYIVFRLTISARSLVYVPAKTPHSAESYGRALKEGLTFLHVTGIETERLPLGKSPKERERALRQIPILRPASGRAENF